MKIKDKKCIYYRLSS